MLTTSNKSNKFKYTQNLGQHPKVSRTVAGCFPTIIIVIITLYKTAHDAMWAIIATDYVWKMINCKKTPPVCSG